ncbi:MAG TPA: TRAP transporter small permease subunit [Geminicoccus sp.]|uniref:TRAP transporter small permease subunit n=1 Tax=Geminicoccus sp. TaxID=2024832 RepID=UPI002B872C67|nr:TRAP transporter small permease subunit [Geminicoccus sp.]HWL68427.1 TRAP transporter small permease subunit [Geminicoccus sp.]
MWIDRLSKASGALAAALIVPAIAISTYEVIARYGFSQPTNWVHPLTTSLCALTFVLAGPYVLQRQEFIRVTFVYDRFGPRIRRVIDLFSSVLLILWGLVLTYAAWLQAAASIFRFRGGRWRPETLGSAWDVPLPALVRGVLFLACALLLLQAVVNFVRAARRLEAVHGN